MPFPGEGIDLFYMEIFGGFGFSFSACGTYLGIASGLVHGTNPPYTINDFLSFYPQFFGAPLSVDGTVTQGSATITGIAAGVTAGIQPGQLLTGQFPAGTVVLSVASATITASAPATGNDTSVTIYSAPPVPLAIIQAYLNLANASLMEARWHEMWTVAMGLYIAHMVTMYLNSLAPAGSTAQQIAGKGLAIGLAVSQSAGDVSFTQENLTGLASWGAWALTQFGQMLITFAQVVGAGAIYVR